MKIEERMGLWQLRNRDPETWFRHRFFFEVSFNTLKYPFNNIAIKYMGSKAVGGHERRVLYFLMEIESHVTEWKKSSV